MQGITSQDKNEKILMMKYLLNTDGGTTLQHECFDANNPARYQRLWFGWPNSLFSEFAEEFLTKEQILNVYKNVPKVMIDEFCSTQLRKKNSKVYQRIFDCDDKAVTSYFKTKFNNQFK